MYLRKWQIKWLNGRSIPLDDSPAAPVRKVLAVCSSVDRAVLPLAVLLLLVLSSPRIYAGQFVNLDFESPRLPLTDLAELSADALPGWQLSNSAIGSDRVLVNASPLGGGAVSFFGPLTLQPNPNQNLYSVRLDSGAVGAVLSGVSISQAGQIPESTKSLRLEAKAFGEFHITLDGAPISMSLALGGSDYDTYFGDISNFAGRSVDLKIETGVGTNPLDQPFIRIGEISFSTVEVPEPRGYALSALGFLGLGWRASRALTRL